MESSTAGLDQFARALQDALIARRLGNSDLAARVTAELRQSVTPAAVSLWVNAKNEPSRDKVFAIERVLDLKPGVLSRCLGYLPIGATPVRTVPQAIDADPALSEPAKVILRAAYQAARR